MDQSGSDMAGIEALEAFIDGELDAQQSASVAAAIYSSPEASALAFEYRDQNAGLKSLFADILEEPIPARMQMLVNGYRSEWRQAG